MLNLIRQRRSVRRYVNENIPSETMELLKKSLHWTATGCNDRGLIFKVIDNKEDMNFFRQTASDMLKKLFKWKILQLLYPNVNRFLLEILNGEDVIFRNAPHMVICAVSQKSPCKKADPFIALSNFDLMAQSCNIGTCWCGFLKLVQSEIPELLVEILGFRPSTPFYAMLFGYPAVEYRRGVQRDDEAEIDWR